MNTDEIKGYLKLIEGVPTLITPSAHIPLEFNPPPKFLEHRVLVNFAEKSVKLP